MLPTSTKVHSDRCELRSSIFAENIRNVESEEGTYPSPVQAEAVVFDTGKVRLTGHADFLAEPHVTVKGEFDVNKIILDYFRPITERYNLSVRKGALDAEGSIEYAIQAETIVIKKLTLDSIDADYNYRASTAPTEEIAKQVGQTARKYSNEPTLEVKVDKFEARNSQLGFINQAAKPSYRVSFTDVAINIENFRNQFKDGVARGQAKGKFMGNGPTQIDFCLSPGN